MVGRACAAGDAYDDAVLQGGYCGYSQSAAARRKATGLLFCGQRWTTAGVLASGVGHLTWSILVLCYLPPPFPRSNRANRLLADSVSHGVAHPVYRPDHRRHGRVGGWSVGRARMRPARDRGFGSLHPLPEFSQLAALDRRPHRRKQLPFFLADVLADQPGKDGDLWLEPLVVYVEVLELGEHPFYDVMFLQGFQNGTGLFGYQFPHGWIEVLLLDGGVHRQLRDDRIDQLPSLNVRSRRGLLELLEQLLDGPVVSPQQRDRIHHAVITPSAVS